MNKLINLKEENNTIHFDFTDLSSVIPKNKLPLKLKVYNYINNKIIWETEIYDFYFATYNSIFFNYVEIYTNDEIMIYSHRTIPNKTNKLYEFFYLWCLTHPNSKGVAIGTHDGMFGEWVQSVVENKTNAILVEASEIQFNLLKTNYENKKNVKLINKLISTKGGKINFYEVDGNYGNSIYKEHLEKFSDGVKIKTIEKDSISIKDLIIDNFKDSPDWLHLDVEGLDGKLLLEFKNFKHLLPKFIIFENENIVADELNEVISFLKDEEYKIINEDNNTLAHK